MSTTEEKLANILRSAGYRVIGPDEGEKPLNERQLGEDLRAAFNDIDHLAFGETFDEATERMVEAGRYLLTFYQISPK